MRSTAIIGIVVIFLVVGSLVAIAQQGPMGGSEMQGGMQQQVTPEQFPAVKAKVLKMLDERKTKIEQERACVEKAQSHEEMKKCRPEPPMGGQHRGPGQHQSMNPGMMGGQQQ